MNEYGIFIPFKIGDTLYKIVDNSDINLPIDRYEIQSFTVAKIDIRKSGIKIYDTKNFLITEPFFIDVNNAIIERNRLNNI